MVISRSLIRPKHVIRKRAPRRVPPGLTEQDYLSEYQRGLMRGMAPEVAAYIEETGFDLPKMVIDNMALPLACPYKGRPGNWHHGYVLYAAVRERLARLETSDPVTLLDIGTAKGFSALIMARALHDAGVEGKVVSVDVVDPEDRFARNSIWETGGKLFTVPEFMAPYMTGGYHIELVHADSVKYLRDLEDGTRFHAVFIDGNHTYNTVRQELMLLRRVMHEGDVIVMDDLQATGITEAAQEHHDGKLRTIQAYERVYGIVRC